MNLYFPEAHYDSSFRMYLFPLLRPYLNGPLSCETQKVNPFFINGQEFLVVSDLSNAHVIVLTMAWNYYHITGKKGLALALIEQAKQAQKQIWIAMLDDFGLVLPAFEQVVVFRASGYRSKLPVWHKGMPIFITDPVQFYFSNQAPSFPAYEEQPKVGFCGLASNGTSGVLKQLLKIGLKNLAFYLKIYSQEPESFVSAPYLRYRCLKRMEKSKEIETNFIMHKHYRAGAKTKKDRKQVSQLYFNNIAESQYVFCARGAGNFSMRLYETLAMGRIPIYLHTDGLLPLVDTIDWKHHMVWVDWNERFQIAEKVITFHKRLDTERLHSLGAANRKLWETHLQMGSFFKAHMSL